MRHLAQGPRKGSDVGPEIHKMNEISSWEARQENHSGFPRSDMCQQTQLILPECWS